MRITLNIDDDVLITAKSIARRQGRSVGSVISELARQGLAGKSVDYSKAVVEEGSFYGFNPLPKRGSVVTDELIDSLREKHEI